MYLNLLVRHIVAVGICFKFKAFDVKQFTRITLKKGGKICKYHPAVVTA